MTQDLELAVGELFNGAALAAGTRPRAHASINAPSCTWQDSSGAGATIAATDPGSVGQIPFGLQNITGAHVTAVSAVGDAAFFAAGGTGATAELDIRKGGRAITITVGSADPNFTQAQQEAAELAIGTAAAKNMYPTWPRVPGGRWGRQAVGSSPSQWRKLPRQSARPWNETLGPIAGRPPYQMSVLRSGVICAP